MPCTHAASPQQVRCTDAIGTEWNRDGSSCLYAQVSSQPSRTCTVRATCSTSAADQYHIWKHEVPTAFVAPSLCPASSQSTLHHSPHCASAPHPAMQSCTLLPGEVGSRECQGQSDIPSPAAATDSTRDQAGTRAELSGLSP